VPGDQVWGRTDMSSIDWPRPASEADRRFRAGRQSGINRGSACEGPPLVGEPKVDQSRRCCGLGWITATARPEVSNTDLSSRWTVASKYIVTSC
jgi:hypothetical protein